MAIHFIFFLLFLLVPAAIVWLTHHQGWAKKIGVIVLCYLFGLLVGNLGLIPEQAQVLQNQVTDLSIAFAMPLLLFSLDLGQWRHIAGKALLSMLLATTAVVTVATCLFFIVGTDDTTDLAARSASNFAAMSVGVYTGGTPNLAAIKSGLDIPHSEYLVFHSLDTLVGSGYLIAMLTVGIPFFRRFLAYSPPALSQEETQSHHFDGDNYLPLMQRKNLG
ncbi:MAG: putative membrane protein, partial [Bacteroidia bacterium]